MQPNSPDIEQIIRVVMQRLAAAGDLMSGVGAIADTQEIDSELVLRDRVITLATLNGKLVGKKKVRVHPRAIITPAVTDELRRYKVELIRDAVRTSTSTSTSTNVAIVAPILVCGSAMWFSSLSRHLCPKQATVQACDDKVALSLVQDHKTRGGARAIWLSATPYAASVAAARAACCTAVHLNGLGDLNAALVQADPDCVIVDPSRFTVAAIGNLVRAMFKHKRP